VRFDDRLRTVLAQPSSDPHDCAVRWRQLVDLLARGGRQAQGAIIDEAIAAVQADWHRVAEPLRAAAARAIADRALPIPLLAAFAGDELAVSAPVLAAARLDSGEWQEVLAAATEEARAFILSLHSELQTRPPAPAPPEAPSPEPATSMPSPAPAVPTISDVLARIERLRQSRERSNGERQRREGDGRGSGAIFRWECGPSGEIHWVEGAPRAALVGRSIARNEEESEGVDRRVQRAFGMRAPFRDATLTLSGEGPVAGEWKISGIPAFEPTQGRFAGYRGVAMRAGAGETPRQGGPAARPEPLDAASLRELVHEIKTPLNAIIGFAEIIDGQLLGPADRRYRERAAEIVRQARLLLSAIDDLDTAAKLQLAAGGSETASDLAEIVSTLAPELREQAAASGAAVEVELTAGPASLCAIEPVLARRLVRRFLSAVVDLAGAGETLRIAFAMAEGGRCQLRIQRPRALEGLADEQLWAATDKSKDDGLPPGSILSLRLVRGLARLARGELVLAADRLELMLPGPGKVARA